MSLFFEFIILYRNLNEIKPIVDWNKNHTVMTKKYGMVASAYEYANFSLIRLDKNLENGAIKSQICSRKKSKF